MVAARSKFLRARIREAREKREKLEKEIKDSDLLEVRLEDAVPEAFEMVLNYIYTDRIDPTRKTDDESSSCVEEPPSNRIVLLMMDVYRLADQFKMERLEHWCVYYLMSTISHANVLEALHNAGQLRLMFIKEFCLNFVIKESNYSQIIMSKEFETLDQPLMVEIIRRRQTSQRRSFCEMYDVGTGTTLEQDMKAFLMGVGSEFCDVTLMLNGTSIPAHKAILAARCNYFEGLFRSFMPVNKMVNMEIGKMIPSSDSFNSLMRYIYYADVSMPPEDSVYLFTAQIFYGFTNNRLQAFCKQNLEMNISFSNVIQILEAADRMQAIDVKKYVLDLIVHHFTEVARLPELRQLSKELLLDIIEALADERCEVRTCLDMVNDCN